MKVSTVSKISIRRLEPTDASLLRRLRLASIEDAPAAFCSPLSREIARSPAEWARMTETALVASRDGSDVGLTFVVDLEELPGVGEIAGMWVAPRVRGEGVARALLERSAAWATERGMDRLLLWVAEDQEAALRCYRSCNFAETGRRKPFPRDDARTIVEMVRPLVASSAR